MASTAHQIRENFNPRIHEHNIPHSDPSMIARLIKEGVEQDHLVIQVRTPDVTVELDNIHEEASLFIQLAHSSSVCVMQRIPPVDLQSETRIEHFIESAARKLERSAIEAIRCSSTLLPRKSFAGLSPTTRPKGM